MVTDYNITECYNEECYEFYYRKKIDWNKYYDGLADKADQEYEDNYEEEFR